MPHWLTVTEGSKVGERYDLANGQGTIGRGPANAIQLFDEEVSRIHCRYQVDGKHVEIADLESSNGTLVNRIPINQHELRSGDQLQIGNTVLEYGFDPSDADENPLKETPASERISFEEITSSEKPSSLSYFLSDEIAALAASGKEASPDIEDGVDRRAIQISSDLNFMYHASLATSGKTNRSEMLDNVVELIFEWVAADRCCVLMQDEGQQTLDVKAFRSRDEFNNRDKLLISQSILNYVRKKRVGILTSNPVKDERLSGKDSIKLIGIQEAICVPIQGRAQLLGLIYVDSLDPTGTAEGERFNRDNLKLMIAIGQQIAFAIENDRNLTTILEQQRLATIGQTTASLSHRMKNLLQGVNGGAHLVEEGIGGVNIDLIKAGWSIVNRNQQELSKLVNDMLILGQPYDPHLVVADLNQVVEDVFKEIGPHLEQHNIEHHWRSKMEPATFRFDPRGIHWALFNLINSCAAACRGITNGEIRMSLTKGDADEVLLTIADNGAPALVDKPGDLFAPNEHDPEQPMNPVELAVSRKLIQQHGGEITISYPESGGNLFSVRLPLEHEPAEEITSTTEA